MANRKSISSISGAELTQLRALLDQYITKQPDNPIDEHKLAGDMSTVLGMSLMIHGDGFLAWHQHFIAKLETWFVNNGGANFVPLPYWDPSRPIPQQLNNGNTAVHMPLPANLQVAALRQVHSYTELNNRILPYHGDVHDAAGGHMPDPETSPTDPIFWPFHAFLIRVYERWRNM